jgi:flagellar assembly protein FliH
VSAILRGVVITRETRALSRPAGAREKAPSAREQVAEPMPGRDLAQERSRGFEAGYDEGRERGYADGFRDGRLRGHEEGLAEGREQGLREAERAEAAARQLREERAGRLLTAVEESLRERVAAAEEDMLALCFEAVTAVFGELAARSDGVRGLLAQVLAQSRQLGAATLHLHPEDLALVADLQALDTPGRQVRFVPDETIALGGCVLVAEHGGLDARVETQLARLGDVLRRVRDEERSA